MRYIVFLNLFLFLLAGVQPAMAADPSRYRVEIIVLMHLEHDEQPREAQRLDDYSAALDFLSPLDESEKDGLEEKIEGAAEAVVEPVPGTEAAAGEMAEGGAAPDGETDPWNVVVHLPELSAQMQEAWRRLRLSGPFRPLQHLAWEQGGDAPFPTLRVHDLEAVLTEDPWAANRALLAEPQAAAAQGQGLAGGAEPPPPIRYYRLDGTTSLTRSRFLHLSIAVELREPLYAGDAPAIEPPPRFAGSPDALPGAAPGSDLDPMAEPVPTSFLVHRLEQSRVVRTGRMEYFDGPVLGVLAWVTDISDTVTEEQTE
jgi:hypothetical protein